MSDRPLQRNGRIQPRHAGGWITVIHRTLRRKCIASGGYDSTRIRLMRRTITCKCFVVLVITVADTRDLTLASPQNLSQNFLVDYNQIRYNYPEKFATIFGGRWRAPIRVIGESVAPNAVLLLTYPPEHDYKPVSLRCPSFPTKLG